MKLATTTAIARTRPGEPNMTMEQAAEWIADAGFEVADANFFFAPGEPDTPLLREDWADWAHTVREQYAALGLPFDQAHSPAFGYQSATDRMSERIALLMHRSFDVCGVMGIPWTVVHPVSVPDRASLTVSRRENIEFFKPLLDRAAQAGVSIAIENMFDTFNYVGDHAGGANTPLKRTDAMMRFRRRFGGEVDELLELVDALHATHPNVGICWDTGHGNEMGTPQVEALELIGGRLKTLHINDNYAIYDDHSIPYHGTINCWGDIMAALKRIGYEGNLTFETGRFSRHIPTPLLAATLRYSAEIGRYLLSLYDKA